MAWKRIIPMIDPVSRSVVDPYSYWALGPGLQDFRLPSIAEQSVPILLRHKAQKWDGEAWALWRDAAEDPDMPERPPHDAQPFDVRFLPLTKALRLIEDPKSRRFFESLERFTIGPPLPSSSVISHGRKDVRMLQFPSSGVTRDTVIIGIIDDGIPFAHERFRKIDGTTRIESVWVQYGSSSNLPIGFDNGFEIPKVDIDNYLLTCRQGDFIDEDEIYRRAGIADFTLEGRKTLAWHASHGAHVMDLACGWDPNEAPDWRIICVQLPTAITADSSGASLAPYAVKALEYIRDRAQAIAGKGQTLPVVINFSYGLLAGPHDGTHVIELAFDRILREHNTTPGKKPMRVVIPSGNSHLARAHASVSFQAKGDQAVLPLRVLPDDLTPSFVEIWLPPATAVGNRVELTIATPQGDVSPPLEENDSSILQYEVAGKVLCEARYHFFSAPTARGMFLISLQPTIRIESENSPVPTDPVVPAGLWKLTLNNLGLLPKECVEAWVQRDDAPVGYPRRGRQSYFDVPSYEIYGHDGRPLEEDDPACPVKRAGSINAIATGKNTIVMGGLLRTELRPPAYSAGGAITTPAGAARPHRCGPDALTVSDDSIVQSGVLAAGTRSGSVVAMNGTSVAAPHITRWIAGELAAKRRGNRRAVWKLAYDKETALPPPEPSPERGGAGRAPLPRVRPSKVER
ncbi:hypothetical protein [Microvirga terrestris]|uniref:Peptidase S8/S53 domain-containing protein n=1 Tax=Microvirga terrestris TaxID=2791024 RepID=A0ABS0HN91_9HYPH|nr:hypothetical protein [Microvirga terrestris]MBF9194943.1 hypothetical protein [Microvirga terrestris]